MNTLIVIQDDEHAGKVQAALESGGHQVTRVPTHSEGLSQAAEASPDAIVYGPAGEGSNLSDFRSSLESRVKDRAIPVLPVGADDDPVRICEAITLLDEKLNPTASDETRTILVVDDKDANRKRLASQFAGHGWKVLEAADEKSTALLLIDQSIDCLMINAMLSGKTSRGIVKSAAEIRKVHPHPYSILVMADAEDSETATRMIESGADDVVGRTTGASLLRRRLQSALILRDLLRENRALKERVAALQASAS